jgi:hypothetical protein
MKNKKAISGLVCVCMVFIIMFSMSGCGKKKIDTTKAANENSVITSTNVSSQQTSNQGTSALNNTSTIQQTATGENTSGVTNINQDSDKKLEIGKPVFVSEKDRKTISLEWVPTKFEKKVKPYTIKKDLSNIVNLKQFNKLTTVQKSMLTKNGFFVTPTKQQQLFYIYENNEYQKVPSFITTDSVLQVYHIFYDYSLRTLEYDKLLAEVEQLTKHMLIKSISVYNKIENPKVKQAALKNIAYFAVAEKALEKELPKDIPIDALDLTNAEYEKILAHEGFEKSSIFPFKLDYSQYIPRGHYTRNHDFERYFIAMMWYGQAPMPMLKKTNNQLTFIDETIQALLMTYTTLLSTNEAADIELWEKIYDPTAFYVGKSDDLNLYQYSDLLLKVFGQEPDLEKLTDLIKLEELYKEALKLPEPQIKAKWVAEINGVDTPVDKQLRFMGQRYIPDSEIMQELVEPIFRPFPKGLDVMGVLGSDRAYDILINTYKSDEKWRDYPKQIGIMKDKFAKLPEATWRSNMYYGWLWVLKGFTNPFQTGYPSFMTNQAWEDKSLSTALGSWAELRHDTILYGKQSGAESGGELPPDIIGYVEPNIEVYEKLLWLTKYSKQNLTERKILPEGMQDKLSAFEDLLQFLINCSVKELKNEELSKEEYNRIQYYGGTLESISGSLAGDGLRWFEISSETDKNMAVVADVHTTPGYYLEEGVGTAAQIYVVVPIGGKLYITTGAVFDYYEFVNTKRLTDEEWQKILNDNAQPERPEWTKSFIKK